MISFLPIYSLIEVKLSANWLAWSKFLTVIEACMEWIFCTTPMATLSLFVSVTTLSNIWYFFLYSYDMLWLHSNLYSFSSQIFWIINDSKFCNPFLQHTDDKCHHESSAEKYNEEPLTEKSHQKSTKSANSMLNFIYFAFRGL